MQVITGGAKLYKQDRDLQKKLRDFLAKKKQTTIEYEEFVEPAKHLLAI